MSQFSGHDIIALTYSDWHASWSTPQQIMSRLAGANRVLYVDQPRSLLYGLKPRDPQGAGVWSGPRVKVIQPGLFVYHPPHRFIPVHRLPLAIARRVLEFNGLVLAAGIRREAAALGFRDPIVWNFSILHATAVPLIERKLTIYDICDEWEQYIPNESGKQLVRWVESCLYRSADLLFVATESARAKRDGVNDELHVVPHAADFGHFAKALDPATKAPEDLAKLPRPIVGSVGVMDPARFDVDLILRLAQAHREWSIVLVGPARADMELSRLRSCANVYLPGNRAIAELPAYLKGMDVAMIPYRVNDATRDIFPLKLMEYLAAGKPVVSADLPAVRPYAEVAAVASDHEDFMRAVEAALAGGGPGTVETRQAVARANAWEQRIAEKMAHIERLLASE